MAITTGSHPKALWPGVKAWWGRAYNEHPVEYTDLFDMDTSSQNFEEDVQVQGFGLAPVKNQGANVFYDTENQGYVTRYTHVAYALGFVVTHEEMKDNLYAVVGKRRGQSVAFSMRQTKENVGANVYNRAFNASYTFGDGQVLISASHPSSNGNWSNKIATNSDLSESAIESLLISIMTATNDKGLKIGLRPQSLHIHPDFWFIANRVLKSTLQSYTGDNNINVIKATNALPKGIKMNHYFSDSDAWFVRTSCYRGMIGYDREHLPLQQDTEFRTMNVAAFEYERYSFGCTDPRGVYGSPGA